MHSASPPRAPAATRLTGDYPRHAEPPPLLKCLPRAAAFAAVAPKVFPIEDRLLIAYSLLTAMVAALAIAIFFIRRNAPLAKRSRQLRADEKRYAAAAEARASDATK